MVADPIPAPVTCGCVAGVVAPGAMETLAGAVTFDVSLLVRFTVTPPGGAGCGRVTGNAADWPSPTVVLAGALIGGSGVTVTLAVALAIPAALAMMVAEPGATPVTRTSTLVALAAKVTVPGTVATAGLLELRLTVNPPAGAGAGRFSVRFPVLPTMIDNGDPVKLIASGA